MSKFTSVDKQIEILETRGIVFNNNDDRDEFKKNLYRFGYYNLINAYKDMFIDVEKTQKIGEDRYTNVPGLAFYAVHIFDNVIRQESLQVLLLAEETLKAAIVNAFCSTYCDDESYLDPACYVKKKDYRYKNYTKNFSRLLISLQSIRENKYRKSYVQHYIDKYGYLPFWVAANCMTFGNLSSFYDLQTNSVKSKVCANIKKAIGRDVQIAPKQLRAIFNVLSDFRNVCAHGERVYNYRTGKTKEQSYKDMLSAIKIVTPDKEYLDLMVSIFKYVDVFDMYAYKGIKEKLINEMGFDKSEYLDLERDILH